MLTKKGLAVELSRISSFIAPCRQMEQYPTDSEAAAELLWQAYMRKDIRGKTVADMGAGTGILGTGALMLGAGHVFFVEKDPRAAGLISPSFPASAYEVLVMDARDFSTPVDTVIQNPPFGTSKTHADRDFLLQALSIAGAVYSVHKSSTRSYLESLAARNGFLVEILAQIKLPLKKTMPGHKRKIHRIEVDLLQFRHK